MILLRWTLWISATSVMLYFSRVDANLITPIIPLFPLGVSKGMKWRFSTPSKRGAMNFCESTENSIEGFSRAYSLIRGADIATSPNADNLIISICLFLPAIIIVVCRTAQG